MSKSKVLFDYKVGLMTAVDSSLIPDGGLADSLNVSFDKGAIHTMSLGPGTSYRGITNSPTKYITGLWTHQTYTQQVHYIAATRSNIYLATPGLNLPPLATGVAWPSIGSFPTTYPSAQPHWVQGAGVFYTEGTSSRNSFLLTDGLSPIQEINLDSGTLAPLGGSPPVARVMCEFFNHLLLGHVNVGNSPPSPFRVQWSNTGKYSDWSSSNSGFTDLVDDTGPIVGFASMGDRLYVYKLHSIWECQYVGTPKMFDFHKVVDGVGLHSPSAVCHTGTSHIFYGSDKRIYEFNGRELQAIDEQHNSYYNIKSSTFYDIEPIDTATQVKFLFNHVSSSVDCLFYKAGNPALVQPTLAEIWRYHLQTNSWWKTSAGGVTSFVLPTSTIYQLNPPTHQITRSVSTQPPWIAGVKGSSVTGNNAGLVYLYEGGWMEYPTVTGAGDNPSAFFDFKSLVFGGAVRVTSVWLEISNLSGAVPACSIRAGANGTPILLSTPSGTSDGWLRYPCNLTLKEAQIQFIILPNIELVAKRCILFYEPRKRPFEPEGH